MKKILLTMALFGAVLVASAQTVLNELYTDPGSGRTEFFEIYNGSGGAINTDCFTLITYYSEGSNTGFYVLDLPAGNLQAAGFYVGASADPYNVQGTSGTPNFSWNALPASGRLTKWQRNGTSYTDVSGTIPANFNDLFQKQTGSGAAYSVFLYANGILVNAFFGGQSSSTIPSEIRAMPDLDVDMLGACADFTARFDATSLPNNRGEYVTPTPGSDNGYYRLRDGQCGSWIKGAPSPQHSPGVSNGAPTGTGTLTTSAVMNCNDQTIVLNYSVSSGGPVDAYPVTIIVYEDLGRTDPGTTPNVHEQYLPNGVFDASDTVVQISGPFPGSSGQLSYNVIPKVSPAAYTFPFPPGGRETRAFIVVFQTPQGCFDKVLFPGQCAQVLPVTFSLFTAKRTNSSSVSLVWQTAMELNNSGFEVQRNINGNWETVAFVPTQASGGNSDALLNYSYSDMNSAKGMTQYRIKQIDFDGKSEYSVVRAVRGDGVSIKTIIYPNPSFDGKVNVVFEDANGTRDIVLMDMSGRMVRNWRGVSNNNLTIDNLNPGMYSLRITVRETGAQTVEKLVVNKR